VIAELMSQALDDPGTVGFDILSIPPIPQTRTSAQFRTCDAGYERRVAGIHSDKSRELHQERYADEWAVATRDRAKAGVARLLTELACLGFAWRDVARMVGVSVPAVQKWRRGDGATGENRQKLASLLAACDIVAEHYAISDISSWFEIPIRTDTPITPIDLWADGKAELVFEHASGHDTPDGVLTQWDPNWRERYRSDFEVFHADDGQLAIRPQSG
jgi:transcriptional regulator with XRE-family HTH domain